MQTPSTIVGQKTVSQADDSQRYRVLFEQSSEMVLLHDLKGVIIGVNQRQCDALGYSTDQPCGLPLSRLVSPEHALRTAEIVEEIFRMGALRFETVYQCEDGELIPVEVSATRFVLSEESFAQWVARDITERERERCELRQYAAELAAELGEANRRIQSQDRLAMIGQLTSSVSHELRNPLGVLSNSLYFLSMVQADQDPRVAKHLRIMKRELEECQRIVDELLEFSRDSVIEPEEVNLAALIDKALERVLWLEKIQIKKDFPAQQLAAMVDPKQIVQVLVNLFANAIEAMPDGGTLRIRLMQEGGTARIVIQDTGRGIDAETLPHIFEPLFTTKPKGIGLGLALCKRLVELHGGEIAVESVPHKGSTFTLNLPVVS